MTSIVVADESEINESKLKDELLDIQIQYEKDMQAIADQIEALNVRYQKNIEWAYMKFRTPIPKKHKPPDMS